MLSAVPLLVAGVLLLKSHEVPLVNTPDDLAAHSYAFWKELAQSNLKGWRYFSYAGMRGSEPVFREDGAGAALTLEEAVHRANSSGGFFFFDTADGREPRPDAEGRSAGNLTPKATIGCEPHPSGASFVAAAIVVLHAEELECRCLRHRGAIMRPRDGPATAPGVRVHLDGIVWNAGDVRLGKGFTVHGYVAAAGQLRLAGRGRVVHPSDDPEARLRRSRWNERRAHAVTRHRAARHGWRPSFARWR